MDALDLFEVCRYADEVGPGWLAAVRFPDGACVTGASHRRAWKASGRDWDACAEEGFVDPSGRFVTRQQFHDATGILPKSGELRDLGMIGSA